MALQQPECKIGRGQQVRFVRVIRRSWSLRSLLLVPVVLAPICWYASTVVREFEEERYALGQMPGLALDPLWTTTAPSWLRLLGFESRYFSRVRGISLWGVARDVPRIDHLRRLRHLECLSVHDPTTLSMEARRELVRSHYPFVEAVTRVAVKLPLLRELDIRFTGIDDHLMETIGTAASLRELLLWRDSETPCGVEALGSLRSLESLSLHRFRLSERDAAALAELAAMETLDLYECGLNDGAVQRLASLPALRHLDLGHCPVTDAAVNELTCLRSLGFLSLAGCDISDHALEIIGQSGLRHMLRCLYLGATPITDRGVDYLRACDALEQLSLRETNVTAASLAPLAEFPKLARNVDLADTYADGDGTPCLKAFFDGASADELRALYLATQEQRIGGPANGSCEVTV